MPHSDEQTRATLLLRLRSEGPEREVAWQTFYTRYEPVIAGFARAMGTPAVVIPEIIQDVMSGFFAVQPRFAYDPSKGRFRGYLRTCVVNALRSRAKAAAARGATPLGEIDPADARIEPAWDAAWDRQRLSTAIEFVRAHYEDGLTFRAFEAVVVHGRAPSEVAQALGLSLDSVYQAKTRVLARLRIQLDVLGDDLDGPDNRQEATQAT